MSHSPESSNASKSSQDEYVRQWYALEELIRDGKSFSGKERNCAFLNTADGRFTDVSGAMSWDFQEDGRSIALTDWDQDGDLDTWVRNRNAAGLRFLRNELPRTESTLSFHLRGTQGNPDAVGARITVDLDGTPARKLVKTLHAGEGFRGQSTKWLHFGLEGAGAIRAVTVRWPDGKSEAFTGVAVGKRWELNQGAGQAKLVMPARRTLKVAPAKMELPEASGIARVLVMSQPPAPRMTYTSLVPGSAAVDVAEKLPRPLLVNLFATWCTPCALELKELGAARAKVEAVGVDLLALSLDALRPGDKDSKTTDPATFLKELGYTGPSGAASAELLANVQTVVQQIVDNRRALPVPTSILLTKEGRVGVIYFGRVSVQTLQADAKLLAGPAAERWNHITDLKGRWHLFPEVTSLSRIAYAMRESGNEDEARRYETAEAARVADSTNAEAMRLMASGDVAQAEQMLRAVVAKMPDHAPALANLGVCLLMRGAFVEAEPLLAHSAELDPSAGMTQLRLGHAMQSQGKMGEAIPHLREATKLLPGSKEAALRLAWLLAIKPSADAAEKAEALKLASLAQKLEPPVGARDVDVLAAAQAASGRHADAAASERRAIALARESSPELVAEMEARLKLYEEDKAFTVQPPG